MNTRFKFRVWFDGRYIYKSLCDSNAYTENDKCICLANNLPDLPWEQCTGLRDKNGKLVYEGDIVKKEFKNKPFSSKAKTKEKLILIKWSDVEACFSFDFLNEKEKHDDFQTWEFSWGHKYSYDEVIGNIHENADLINVGEK